MAAILSQPHCVNGERLQYGNTTLVSKQYQQAVWDIAANTDITTNGTKFIHYWCVTKPQARGRYICSHVWKEKYITIMIDINWYALTCEWKMYS